MLFLSDPTINERVHIAIINNPNGNNALQTRLFHNKIGFLGNDLFLSLARSTDPVFFFSLFHTPYYGTSYYVFASPIYFPFFLLGLITLIRKWDSLKKKYWILPPLLIVSLCIDALFIPYTAPIKLLPLFITVQLVLFLGCYEFCLTTVWGRKLFSH